MTLNPPILRVEQQSEYWCWAACSEMVVSHYGLQFKQCDIVNRCFDRTDACTHPSLVDLPLAPERLGPILAQCGLHNSYYTQGLQSDFVDRQLQQGSPIIAMVSLGPLASSMYHLIVLAGFTLPDSVYFIDPAPDNVRPRAGWTPISNLNWVASWAQFHL